MATRSLTHALPEERKGSHFEKACSSVWRISNNACLLSKKAGDQQRLKRYQQDWFLFTKLSIHNSLSMIKTPVRPLVNHKGDQPTRWHCWGFKHHSFSLTISVTCVFWIWYELYIHLGDNGGFSRMLKNQSSWKSISFRSGLWLGVWEGIRQESKIADL